MNLWNIFMDKRKILIIEDDITFALMLKTWLSRKGFDVIHCGNITDAQKRLSKESFDLILSDLRLPDQEGTTLLSWLKKQNFPIPPFIIMTSYADIQSAVSAIKSGASDYIAKPFNPEALLIKINDIWQQKAENSIENNSENEYAKVQKTPIFTEGKSEQARQLYEYIRLVAPTDMSVLINGASGTGKEHIAQEIHQLSKRKEKPFIAIDCGAIPRDLAASEFFGHVKGSFTGALTDKTGAFVAAQNGTLFLDEIGNLSYEVQVQLLRALQERKIKPIGSNQEITVNIRLVTATNENLEEAIKKGSFREDLYHRINEFSLHIPTLKERQDDILLFADLFLDQANQELGKHVIGFTPECSAIFLQYNWPGNLRQMKNVIKRAALLATDDYISPTELPPELLSKQTTSQIVMPLRNESTEKILIKEALEKTGNNKSKAAKLLQIDRKTLYNKLKLYDLE